MSESLFVAAVRNIY